MPRPTDMMRRLARLGAEARILQIREEMQEIHREFPDLRSSGAAPNGALSRITKKKRTMSAAQRKAVGARMKKYWAERRKANK